MGPIAHAINIVLYLLMLDIVASVVLSWLPMLGVSVPRYNPVLRAIEDLASLVLNPIRRALHTSVGAVDFSPIIAFVLIQIVQRLVMTLPF